jgi:hypothetical protein
MEFIGANRIFPVMGPAVSCFSVRNLDSNVFGFLQLGDAQPTALLPPIDLAPTVHRWSFQANRARQRWNPTAFGDKVCIFIFS